MEAHEGILVRIGEFALDGLPVHILGDGVVDVEQGNCVLRNACPDVLAQRTVDVDLTGDRDAAAGETAVHIAGNEAELGLESGPAFSCDGDILAVASVLFDPVKERQLILGQLLKNLRLLVACAKLCSHIGSYFRNAGIAGMLVKCLKKIQLRVLLDFNAQVVELLDGCVAGKEIQRSRTEGDDLEVGQADHGSRDGQKVMDHVSAVFRVADRIFGDISADITELQVVACVEHAAECIAASLDQVILGLLGSCTEHLGAVKMLSQKSLGDFGTEVSEVDAECVAACSLDVCESLYHMDLALDDTDRTFINVRFVVLGFVSVYKHFSAVHGEALRETVTADGDDAKFHFGDVADHAYYLLKIIYSIYYIEKLMFYK